MPLLRDGLTSTWHARRNCGRMLFELLRYEDAVKELEAARSLDAGDQPAQRVVGLAVDRRCRDSQLDCARVLADYFGS